MCFVINTITNSIVAIIVTTASNFTTTVVPIISFNEAIRFKF